MGENGARNFRSLQEEGANFYQLSKDLLTYVERQPKEKDLLYGKSLIFLQEEYKIWLDKALMVK